MDNTLISIILGIATLTLTMILNYFAFVLKATSRIVKLESDHKIFWAIVEPHLAQIIHSPSHTERDELVQEYIEHKLPENKYPKLAVLLQDCINTCEDKEQKMAAVFLLARVAVDQKRLQLKEN